MQAAAAAAAAARLIHLKFARRFPALVSWLVFLAGIDLCFGLLDRASPGYFWAYIVLETLKCALSIIAVRELFALTFSHYPGIRTGGRLAMYAGLVLALSISVPLTHFFWDGGPNGRSADLFFFEVSQRSVVFTLALVIATILVFLSKYPLHLSENAQLSAVFFSILFLSEAVRLFIDSTAPKLSNPLTDWPEALFVFACLVSWAALLKPESARAPARVTFSPPQDEHLLQQLDALNNLLTRASKK